MGWLSNIAQRIKGLFNKNKTLNPGVENNGPYGQGMDFLGIPVRDDNTGETIYFRECRDTGVKIPYSDGQQTAILEAKIYRHDDRSNDVMLLKGGTSVCFEVPLGTTLDQLKDSGWLHYMLNQPAASEQNLSSQKFNTLGRIDFKNGTIHPTDPAVEMWIDHNLTAKLQQEQQSQRQEAEAMHMEAEMRRQADMQEKMSSRSSSFDYRAEERRQNMLNPKFIGSPKQGMYELNSLQNGNIISLSIMGAPSRIRHRDGSIDYVYTAYRKDRESYHDAMILNSLGANIQFSLSRPIEEMFQLANDKSNPDNARAIATMMEQLMDMPRVGNSLFVGAIKEQNGSFVFGDEQNAQKTLNLLGQSSIRSNNDPQIDKQSQYDR